MISVLQSSLCTGDIVRTALSISSTEGALIVSKNTSEGRGSPCAADLASRSTCSFSPLGIFFTKKPLKEASSLRTVSKYFSSFGSLALLLLSIWPEMTWESVLRIALFIPIAFSFRSPNRRASYSAMLFVQLKSSLAAYHVLTLEGATRTAAAPAPKVPQEPSQKTVQASASFVTSS
jgi:hypothetical protein